MTWAKLDDQFPDHPKIVAAGPICELIQIRAICYCCRYLTDGFVPDGAVAGLLVRLDGLTIPPNAGMANGMAPAIADWPNEMVKHGLWQRVSGGYFVHDFLDYNPSKREVIHQRKEKSRAGRKGAKSRWDKVKRSEGSESKPRMAHRMAGAIAPAMAAPMASARGNSMPPSPSYSPSLTVPPGEPSPSAGKGRHAWPPGASRDTRWTPASRWPYEAFNHDCPEPAWRGHCVATSWAQEHPGQHPVDTSGAPKQCPAHRTTVRGA